jgi:acyl transferase domain-containing protein/NADP-dependent 3-hydroxy acid dehydrogenase YdfG
MSHQEPEGLETAVAVVGMACHLPGARNPAQYWANLRAGVESIQDLSDAELQEAGVDPALVRDPNYVRRTPLLEDMDLFDAGFFGLSPKDAAIMDPQHRHFLECVWEALEDCGHVPERFEGSIGVFAGCGTNAYLVNNLLTNPELVRTVGFFLLRHTGNDKDFLATRASYNFDLRGPSVNVQTACSTSLVAIHMACQSLLNGECDLALAGGSTIRQPHRVGHLFKEGEILSRDGRCRSFDAASEGTIFGSGAGVVALRRLQDAVRDGDPIYAVIRGSAINNDGSQKVGFLAPSVDGQAHAVAEALALAGVEAETIGFVEAHGTATPVGDPIEITALTQAFGTESRRYCAIGSVKSNIGHLDTAAGVAGFIKAVLAVREGEIPASLHFEKPNPAIDFDASPFFVADRLQSWPALPGPRRAGVNSLGAGGTNAHVILEQPPAPAAASQARPYQLLLLSARSRAAVERASADLARHLEDHPQLGLADVAYTTQVGRRRFKHRRAVVCTTAEEAVDALLSSDDERVSTHAGDETERSIVFMFAGGGAQYPGMGRDLYQHEPVYREAVDECLELVRPELDCDLRALLFPAEGEEDAAAAELERPSRALPALFTTQYAQARLWQSWDIQPAAMIGHSMGEYTAACLAGVFPLRNALALVALRGRLFETLPPGGMLSVPLSPDALRPFLGGEISIGAVNGPELTMASGPVAAIERLERSLAEHDVQAQRIHIRVAAHSSMLDPILDEFGAYLRTVPFSEPTVPYISNLSGTWARAEEAMTPDYWVRHLRNTVQFADGLRTLFGDEDRILLEVGPGRTLATLARLHPERPSGTEPISSLRHFDQPIHDLAFMLGILGRLWQLGADVDWAGVHGGESRRRVSLPTYPFERQPHWIAPGRPAPTAGGAVGAGNDLRKRSDIGEWFYQPSWRRVPLPQRGSLIGDILMFVSDGPFSDRLADQLAGTEGRVVRVRRAAGFAEVGEGLFECSTDRGDLEALLEAIGFDAAPPSAIVWGWSLGEPGASDEMGELEQRCFYGPLHLAQALGRHEPERPVRLCFLVGGSQQVGEEPVTDPARALVLGPARVIPRELPWLRSSAVDIVLPAAGTWRETRLLELVASEIAGGEERVVALRGGDRWVEAFEPLPLGPVATRPARLRQQGVYLITGGLGGLGLEIARDLARTAGARLALVGRTPLPPRREWASLEAGDGRAAEIAREIEDIERAGGAVLPLAADVTDEVSLRQAVSAAVEHFGALHGVFHAAGVLDDGLLQLKEDDAAARVLAPKVHGTLALDRALAGHSLDFLILFSSRSSVAGIAGQVDYTAANAFLDAFARWRTERDGAPTLSLGWSAWGEVGMAAALRGETRTHAVTPRPAEHPLFDERITEPSGHERFVAEFRPGRHWMLDEHRIAGGDALIPGSGYLELARAAFQHRSGNAPIRMRDVLFLRPFAVKGEDGRDLQVRLEPNGGDFHFVIVGRPAGSAIEWQEHARGRIGSTENNRRTANLEAIRATMSTKSLVFSGARADDHLELGPRWASLLQLDYGDGEALASLALPDTYLGDLQHFKLHPALMDIGTACAKELIEGYDEHQDFYVPASYGSVTVHAPLERRVFSHIRYRPDSSAGKEIAAFDISIYDEAGRELVDISEFVMVRVVDRQRMSEPDAASMEDQGPVVIMPAEGTEALRRLLNQPTPPHVFVSPQHLPSFLASLDQAPAQAPRPKRPKRPTLDTSPVEVALVQHLAVKEAAARAFYDAGGDFRVVVWVVYEPIEQATVSELRRYLRGQVDEQLVPQNFVELTELPRTSNGQVDRDQLIDPLGSADDHVAPRTPTEVALARIWHELLGLEAISIYDNFLDIGGHSLLAMRALLRIEKELGVRLGPSPLNLQTLEQIAAEIDRQSGRNAGGGKDVDDNCVPSAAEDEKPAAALDNEPEVPQASKARRGFFSAIKQSVGLGG